MADAVFQDFDLLGDPIPANHGGKGRPPHLPTAEKARILIMLAALGKKQPEMAAALGVTIPTLRKHYFSAKAPFRVRPEESRDRLKAKLLAQLYAKAEDGSVAAIRALWDRLDKVEAEESAQLQPAPAEATEKLGKKEQALVDAQNVEGLYTPPAAPVTQH